MKKILVLAMALALVAALAAPLAALAATGATGNTDISGSITGNLELTAPSAIGLSVMAVGDNIGASATPGNVNCNYPDGYTLTVQDGNVTIGGQAKGAIEGYMWTGLTGTTLVLAGPLQVKAGTMASLTPVTSQLTAKTTSVPSYNDHFSLDVRQPVTDTDPAGSYRITLLFTATVNP